MNAANGVVDVARRSAILALVNDDTFFGLSRLILTNLDCMLSAAAHHQLTTRRVENAAEPGPIILDEAT